MAARAKTRKTFKRHILVGQRPDYKVISQKCFTKIAKMVPLRKMATRAKNRKKTLNVISF